MSHRALALLIVSSALVACSAGDPAPGSVGVEPAAAAAPAPAPAPVLTEGLPPRKFGALVVSPGGFDVGTVDPNTKRAVRMTLTNTASEPLTIVATFSDCKCTVPENLEGTVIAPGESVPMEGTFQLRASPGVKEAKMQLSFRVGSQPIRHAIVKIKGEVIMAIRAVPAYVDALKGVTSGTVKVESMDKSPFRIISAGGAAPSYADGFNPDSDSPRPTYTLRWDVRYPARQEDCDGERLWWVVETDDPDCPVLPLRIRHECTGLLMDQTYSQRGWIFSQYMVNAGEVRVGEPVDLDIEVRRLEERLSTGIYGAASLTPVATVEYLDILEPPNENTTVSIRFTAQPGSEGMQYAMATIQSSGGDKEIAILARVMPK